MKKLLVTALLLISLQGLAQEHIRQIVFDNVSSLWQHLVVDSSRLNDDKLLGTKHLLPPQIKVFSGDTIAYFVYVDKSSDLQGAYLEKIDLRSGIVLWHNVFGMNDSGRREFPTYGYINENNELELLCMRNSQDSFIWLWGEGHLAIRQYDIKTGQLLEHIYRPDDSLNENDKMAFLPGLVIFYPIKGRYAYFTPYIEPLFTAYYKEFDLEANFLTDGSLKRDSFYISGSSNPPILLGNKNLVYFRHSFKQSLLDSIKDENYDSMRFIVDYYKFDEGLDSLSSIDLSDYLPYNWNITLTVEQDNSLRVLCKDSVDFPGERAAFVFFNESGEYIETLNFGKRSLANLYITKMPNTNNALVFESSNKFGTENRSINIWRSDGNGNLNKIKEIEFEDSRHFRIYGINILKDGTYIIHIVLHTLDPDHSGSSLNSVNDVVAFRSEDLGIVGTSEYQTNSPSFDIFPNPTNNKINIELKESIQGTVKIYDNIGRELYTDKFNGMKKDIDVSKLSVGIYNITIYSKGEKIKTMQFVKE